MIHVSALQGLSPLPQMEKASDASTPCALIVGGPCDLIGWAQPQRSPTSDIITSHDIGKTLIWQAANHYVVPAPLCVFERLSVMRLTTAAKRHLFSALTRSNGVVRPAQLIDRVWIGFSGLVATL